MIQTKKQHLLIVDDDKALSPMIEEYLVEKGYRTTLCHNATDGYQKFTTENIDLCILDIRMPMKNGFELAKDIMEHSPHKPFLFLTSETEKKKRIEGLKMGASDYILKPFSMEELYLRVKNILKRNQPQQNFTSTNTEFSIGNYLFNANSRKLTFGNTTQKLSTIETQLLQLFCESEDGYVIREVALNRIWDDKFLVKSRSLNVYISKLRKYFSEDTTIEFHNVHGLGYRMSVK